MSLDNLTSEKIPLTGVYNSYNGKVFLGGREIFRVSDALIRISNNPAGYAEVGSQFQIPYKRQVTVAGNIRRAFVNLYEWAMAIGLPADDAAYIAGAIYEGVALDGVGSSTPLGQIDTLLVTKNVGDEGSNAASLQRPKNHYPIKTTMKFEINTDEVLSGTHTEEQISGTAPNQTVDSITVRDKRLQTLEVYGVMIDTVQLSVGGAGELITSGPFDWVGSSFKFKVEEIT